MPIVPTPTHTSNQTKMINTYYSIIFISYFLFKTTTITTTTTTTAARGDLVDQTCKKSSQGDPNIDYKFCLKAFGSSPSSHGANLTRLGLISINLLKHNVFNTTCLIKGMLGTKVIDNETKQGLEDCLELYDDSILTISEAARDYRTKRMNDANVKVCSVMDACDTCQQGFQDVGVVSPLSKQNNCTFQLSAIALSIIDMLSYKGS